jgi:fibronectin-binding autotransporter adhesin
MKSKTSCFRPLSPHPNSITLSVGLAIATAALSINTAHAASATWDGGGGTNVLNTPTNWTGDVLPNTSGDTATWDGTLAGNLLLNWNAGFGGPAPEATTVALAAGQAGNLTIDATGNFDFSLNSISIAASAGAFTLGDGVGTPGSSGRVVFRSDLNGVSPENVAYKNNFLTNDSSKTATWGADLNFGATGGAPRNLVFGGTGNWLINSNLAGVGLQITKSGAGTLTLTNTNDLVDVVVISAGTLKIDGSGQIRSGAFGGIFSNAGTFHYNSSAAQTISSAISGTGNLIHTGVGGSVLTLSNAASSYTGTTTINGGTLSAGTLAAGGANSSIGASTNAASNLVINGGTLRFTGGGTTDRNFTIGDSNATLEGTGGQMTLTGTASFATPDAARTLTLTGVFGAGGTAFNQLSGVFANNGTGALNLVKNGTGNWRLEPVGGINSFTGGVTINDGGVHYAGSGAFGSGIITLNGGGIVARGAGGNLANNLVANGNFYLGAAGVGTGMGFTGNIDLGGATRTITFPGAGMTLGGIISNGGFVKEGSATVRLDGANTFVGGTTLNAGELQYGNVAAFGTGTLTINGGGIVARGAGGVLSNNVVANANFYLGATGIGSGMGFSGTVNLGGGSRTITLPGGVDLTISGVISNGALTKAGTSKLTLTGTNTYAGATTVTAGTLVVDGDAIPNTGTLVIDGGVVDPAGNIEQVSRLFFGAVEQAANKTYGAVGSGADVENDTYFLPGSFGLVQVQAAAGGYSSWASNVNSQTADLDFNNDGVDNGVAYFMNNAGTISLPGPVGGAVSWTNGGNIAADQYGTQYVVQTSQTLVTWTNVPVGSLTTNTTGPGGSLTYTLPTGQGKWFVRLVVTPN